MTPGAIPLVGHVVRELRADDARRLARQALSLATAAEVEQFLFDALAASVDALGAAVTAQRNRQQPGGPGDGDGDV